MFCFCFLAGQLESGLFFSFSTKFAKMGKLRSVPPHPRRKSAPSLQFLLGLALGIPILFSFSYLQQQWTTHKPLPFTTSDHNHHVAPMDAMNPWPSVRSRRPHDPPNH